MDYNSKMSDGVDSWETMMLLYKSALMEVGTKLEILNEEFKHIHQYNPIEHIKQRIKSPESIVKKLKKRGLDSTIENMREFINDIAGIRVICSFTSDIYRIAEMIRNQNDIKVISVKDYIISPKESGYKSFHMIVSVPIYLSDSVVDTKVEIQIRTVAMDFWASLEHKVNYKLDQDDSDEEIKNIRRRLYDCAQMVSVLDDEMLALNEKMQDLIEKQEKERAAKRI
ncbi:MAG: GTP pyrophosphokinase family protein [Lachnospiraceae bacterium]|jgi:putative GTP pyrophosphokinase|nr:GTP pyrophosphokinase family protein [Lachnospiraceae bacterium]MCI6408554.1 GTP pyrophosphokinase family protein [Lachnospiraceae bacterium]MCI6665487.1 GTP pyrophosphokinase family protein [Lachnospiraceae bacterium]MCI6978812.1 GTP pyrophosphokinase family protein [Lachnospiraceae bacterium]MDY3254172.1 GTP pyrophosphokinase family protein [Lachnospiraceae bacterium]